MDNVDDMILLIEVADTGSFTRAAAQLSMPKSTVSQRIAQLEERLGLRLLNRSTRHVSLTGSGQVYLEYCRRVRAEVWAANTAMANLKDQPVGNLKITCPEITATYFMPGFLREFTSRFPKITVELIATNRHLEIMRERVDFAFRVGAITGRELIVRKISSIRRALVASPAYLAASPPLREPGDFSGHRCLVHDAQPEWEFTLGDRRLSLEPVAAAISDSMGFLLQTSIADGGIALLPAYVCRPAITAGQLVQLMPAWQVPSYEMVMISPKLKNQSNAQIAFRSYVSTSNFSRLAAGM